MPSNYIKKLAGGDKKKQTKLEKKWDEAKKAAAEQGHEDDFDYITAIFKKMAGVNESIELDEARKDDFDKVVRAIKSAQTPEQLKTAMKMGQNFDKLYGPKFIDYVKEFLYPGYEGDDWNDFVKVYKQKKAKMEHEKKMKKESVSNIQTVLEKLVATKELSKCKCPDCGSKNCECKGKKCVCKDCGSVSLAEGMTKRGLEEKVENMCTCDAGAVLDSAEHDADCPARAYLKEMGM